MPCLGERGGERGGEGEGKKTVGEEERGEVRGIRIERKREVRGRGEMREE